MLFFFERKVKKLENVDIRLMLSDKGISNKLIAKRIGISPEYFSRLMSKPLSAHNRQRIIDAVTKIEKEMEYLQKPSIERGVSS